jgi:phosphoribosylanthranilate isomerase
MKVFVKICGLCSAEAVADVTALIPDAIGFVFWPKSKRNVSPSDVAAWTKSVPSSILKVGVFVDGSPDEILQTADKAGLDVIQLHHFSNDWKEDEKFFQALENTHRKLWRVVHLQGKETFSFPVERVDAYLLDSYSADSPGGTGRLCDWGTAREFVEHSAKPVLLAGGLTPDNVREALRKVQPWGVDVSSGVESSPGKKDIQKVKSFIEQCRSL